MTHEQASITRDRIDYLDGWRGVAISLVLFEHFYPVEIINLGRFGVDLFFVLSGMLMSNILFVKKVPLSTFYKRRISRIFPVFFIFISSLYFIDFALKLSQEHENFLYSLFFLRSYFPETPYIWASGLPIGHLWSLNVEEHSYIILSILTLVPLFSKRAYIPSFFMGCSCILLLHFYNNNPLLAPSHYYLRTETVASFILISAAYSLLKHKFEKYIPSWTPIITLALAAICYLKSSSNASWVLSPFLLAFTVNHLNLTPEIFKNLLSFTPLKLLGIWSFSIYLWQQPLYIWGGQGYLTLLISIILGLTSFYLIENPSRKYLNSRW